jgi:hypothetical protein
MKNDDFKLYGLVSCDGGPVADPNAFEASVCGLLYGGCWPSSLGRICLPEWVPSMCNFSVGPFEDSANWFPGPLQPLFLVSSALETNSPLEDL